MLEAIRQRAMQINTLHFYPHFHLWVSCSLPRAIIFINVSMDLIMKPLLTPINFQQKDGMAPKMHPRLTAIMTPSVSS